MKPAVQIVVALLFVLGFVTGCSDESRQQESELDSTLPVIAMSDLVKGADQYAGQTITVTGLFGGMCPDGADFFFKDKLELIEVVPPAQGLPSDVVIGTPLKVQGVVLVRSEHEGEDEQENAEGYEAETEVKVRAQVIEVNRS